MSANLSGAGSRSAKSSADAGVIAAYREGLGLVAVVAIRTAAATRISALTHQQLAALLDDDHVFVCRWCHHAMNAERIAAAAHAQLRPMAANHQTDGSAAQPMTMTSDGAAALAADLIERAAKRFDVRLLPDSDLAQAATLVAARLDRELDELRRSGGLRSINKSYQTYRIESTARGERVMRYQDWMRRYRENLVREIAANLR